MSFPWCRKGHERHGGALLQHAVEALKARGVSRAFAAYRGDWPAVLELFQKHGFAQAREMVSFVLKMNDMPTPAASVGSSVTPLQVEDLPAVQQLGAGVLRIHDLAALEQYFFRNRYFTPDALFALRSRQAGTPVAVGMLVAAAAYTPPRQVDADMPCFWLGAFGSEGVPAKRINGLFSFLVAPDERALGAYALDLLGYAALQLETTDVETFGAQVPSDAAHLLRFYKSYFRRQGSFPVLERLL